MNPEYVADATVDAAMDARICALLSECFTKPQDVVFRTQRYFREPYPHRWVITTGQGALVAHAGVHEKRIVAGGKTYRTAGLAEVCVHPGHRGQGCVRTMLASIHEWLVPRGFEFAVLFGNPRVYGSSGYVAVGNLVHDSDAGVGMFRKPISCLARELTGIPWPATDVYLPGPMF